MTSYLPIRATMDAKDDKEKPYHSSSDSLTSYPRDSKYLDPTQAQKAECNRKRLTIGPRKRGDEEVEAHSTIKQENSRGSAFH